MIDLLQPGDRRAIAAAVAMLALVHAGLWAATQSRPATPAPDVNGPVASVSYPPLGDESFQPTPAQIQADIKTLAPYTRAIRTYVATGGYDVIPRIADELGLRVMLGAWLDKNTKRNERELTRVVELARSSHSISAIVVGNETIYRGETILTGSEQLTATEQQKLDAAHASLDAARDWYERHEIQPAIEDVNVARLIKVIQRVKRGTGGTVPVTTGEIWTTWIQHPELAYAVDLIAAQVLPYWEGVPANQAVDQAIERYNELRRAYPGKRIVIAEFGWPSGGYARHAAEPGRIEQAIVLREFVARAEALGIDYNIDEAFDQPWKILEGSVGAYWGVFTAARQPKFAWSGPIADNHWKIAVIAVLAGCLLSLPLLTGAGATLGPAIVWAGVAHVVGAWAAAIFAYWNDHYFVGATAFASALGLLLLVPLVMITLTRLEEIAAILFSRPPRDLAEPAPPIAAFRLNLSTTWLNRPRSRSAYVVLAIFSVLWVPTVAVAGAAPDPVMTWPIIVAFAVSAIHFALVYRRHVALQVGQLAAAMLVAMSMQLTAARPAVAALIQQHMSFAPAANGDQRRKGITLAAFRETILASLLLIGAIIIYATNYENVHEVNLFACALVVQSLPFLAPVTLAVLESRRP